MQHGVIARIVTDRNTGQRRGFGFIKGTDGVEVFFHASGLVRDTAKFDAVNEGDHVEYVVTDGPKGPRAEEIRVLA